MCPAVMGKIRCPLRPASMTLTRDRPGDPHPARAPARLLHPADHHRATPDLRQEQRKNTTTHRSSTGKSYARRTGAERTFSTAKDPASNNIARGWTRLMGLTPLILWLTCLLAVRNQRILDRLGRPPGRQRPPRRGRPAAQNPPPAPQDPHRPGHRRHPAMTPTANPHHHQPAPQLRHLDHPALP